MAGSKAVLVTVQGEVQVSPQSLHCGRKYTRKNLGFMQRKKLGDCSELTVTNGLQLHFFLPLPMVFLKRPVHFLCERQKQLPFRHANRSVTPKEVFYWMAFASLSQIVCGILLCVTTAFQPRSVCFSFFPLCESCDILDFFGFFCSQKVQLLLPRASNDLSFGLLQFRNWVLSFGSEHGLGWYNICARLAMQPSKQEREAKQKNCTLKGSSSSLEHFLGLFLPPPSLSQSCCGWGPRRTKGSGRKCAKKNSSTSCWRETRNAKNRNSDDSKGPQTKRHGLKRKSCQFLQSNFELEHPLLTFFPAGRSLKTLFLLNFSL